MKSAILRFSGDEWVLNPISKDFDITKSQLVLCFAAKEILSRENIFDKVREKFPGSQIVMCSTAGEIFHDTVHDNSLVAVAMLFNETKIETASVSIGDYKNSLEAGEALINKLSHEGLAYIMVLSDGSKVNGSELVRGLNNANSKGIPITGGLAGDGVNFRSTLVGLNEQPSHGKIIAVGFYGNKFTIKHASQGGWDTFGPEREISRSEKNIVFEIDNRNALGLYKKYLGPEANDLPGSALLFPLSVIKPGKLQPVVRTILSINEENGSMIFAGEIPQGSRVRFMKANLDKLVTAASQAANTTLLENGKMPDLSLLISCVGRKIVMGPRVAEAVEAVIETIGDKTPIAGFYSYGEISPFDGGGDCQLHNQTITITSFYEHA